MCACRCVYVDVHCTIEVLLESSITTGRGKDKDKDKDNSKGKNEGEGR